jgi:hypothetical protein
MLEESQKLVVRRELDAILSSPAFRSSARCKNFLSFVVQCSLDGRVELLKERLIGMEVFSRSSDYSTGEDSIVRAKATELRRRLAKYYLEVESTPEVRIEIPAGSYAPVFRWGLTGSSGNGTPLDQPLQGRRLWVRRALVLLLVLAGAVAILEYGATRSARSRRLPAALNEFWMPLLRSSRPPLVYVPSPELFRLSRGFYASQWRNSGAAGITEQDMLSDDLQLDPNAILHGKDLIPVPNHYVAKGDAYVAAALAGLFARAGKSSQLRFGDNLSFRDLRSAPTVLIGAFNDPWTLQTTSNLHFSFREQNGVQFIETQQPLTRTWTSRLNPDGTIADDYALVCRLVDPRSHRVLAVAAGITEWGTWAAGDFLTTEDELAQVFRRIGAGRSKQNVEILLKTHVIDSIPGPPRVVDTYVW